MASLPSLANLTDIEDRLGRDLTADETTRTQAMLSDASVVVRSYCRRDFSAGTGTVRLRPRGDKVALPQRPVRAVNSVHAIQDFAGSEMSTPLLFWSWPGGFEVFIGDNYGPVINGPYIDWDHPDTWVDVDYDYGFLTVPDDIITVVANMVVRNLTVPAGGLVDMETVGPYNVRYSTFTSAGPLGLSDADRQVLNRYRTTTSRTVELRS